MSLKKALYLYKELKEIGFDKYESSYYARTAQSFESELLGKSARLNYIITRTKEKNIKKRKIRQIFPEGKIYSKLKEMKFPKKNIKKLMRHYKYSVRNPKNMPRLEE